MISELAEAMVSIASENPRPVTGVIIEEVNRGEWGVGGQGLSTDAVEAMTPEKW